MFSSHTYIKSAILSTSFLTPLFVFAAGKSFKDFVGEVIKLLNLLVPIIVALSLLVFFWGIAVFILNAGNEQKRSEGKQVMMWGVIVLFVMISIWGILRVLLDTFALSP